MQAAVNLERKKYLQEKSRQSEEDFSNINRQERDRLEFTSALKIQSLYRGYIYRFHCSLIEVQNNAARKIQKAWRKYLIQKRFQNLREIIALVTISRFFANYKKRKQREKIIQDLNKYDDVLSFYPSECKKPKPVKKRPKNFWTKKSELGKPIKMTGKGKKVKNSKSDSIPRPMTTQRRSINYKSGGGGHPRKRTILIELPPPWHGKDSRRLSQSQQDELTYNQKGDIQWVKTEIIPLLIKKINGQLNYRDELIEKNEKFRTRLVTKPFITTFLRSATYLRDLTTQSITFIRDTGLYAVTMTNGVIYSRTISYKEDQIFKKEDFDVDSPLFDVAIYPRSGFVYGLDNQWCVRMFNNGSTILKRKLELEEKIPSTKHYLFFDQFGFLWVNLIPQKGNLLALDPLTLHITIKVNLDNLAQKFRFMRSNLRLIDLSLKKPVGFAGVFSGMNDVVLFSPDFGKSRNLRHPNMKGFPCIRKSCNKLFVWSTDCVIYVYELGTSIELVQLKGSFKVDSKPTDVCTSLEPDLIFVSMEDCTLKAYLGSKEEHELRLPESKMTRLEQTFADSILGPKKYTKSRPAFLLISTHHFSSVPNHIDSWSISHRMSIVSATFDNSNINSIWFFNDSQQVNCDEFDKFRGKEQINKQAQFIFEYKDEENRIKKNRSNFLDLYNFMAKFDVTANRGQIQNIFLPTAPTFSLPKLVCNYTLRYFFPYIPSTENGQISSYEAFHYLFRSGILPNKLSDFSLFLKHLTPPSIHKNALPETTYNIKMPVITSGLYNAVTNFIFTNKDISNIIDSINPISKLKESLSLFTISAVSDQQNPTNDTTKLITPSRRWMSLYEKTELNRRLTSLILMEDLVKHELMRRVQRNIDEAFNNNMFDRMIPVPSIDIHQHANLNDIKRMTFSEKPNRNPLLDNKMHESIYHTWSTYTLYSRDLNAGVDLRVIHIPHSLFNHPAVQLHFELVKKVSISSKRITSEIYGVVDYIDDNSRIAIVEDSISLPLSHYLNIHSFLGANSRLILASRSILSKILTLLYQLHKSGIILRTLVAENILLNAQNGTVSIGNVLDCQQLATDVIKSIYLPLPEKFDHYSNPFLPPEYYYEPPRKWKPSFDVWQFGILLLYLITGFLPTSYGTELMKHLDDQTKLKCRKVVVMSESPHLVEPPLYPQVNFFYDWLKGCKVLVQGDRKTWVSDSGECYITTDRDAPASILELDHYHLLPYKNTKLKYDETRLFLEIIASCLQVDPEKRPTVETLLRTIPFNQANQASDILDQYMRQPNSNIFVREFFSPTLENLTDKTFPFALGIISALIFHDEMADEDASYSFPLDSRAAEKVTNSLFEVKFMDLLIVYILKRIEERITYHDVNPSINFKDDAFNSFLHLLERFVGAVENGQGSLINHIDEVVLTLLALYAGNPRLRYSSEYFLENPNESLSLASTGSAAVFVFTHTNVKAIVNTALQSTYILNTLKRTTEHNDYYFNKFLSFGDKVFNLANAMVHSIEKQRGNAIYLLMNYWGTGQLPYVIRLFIDFRVPQMVIHCLLNSAARTEASQFINEIFQAIKLKSFEPTYLLLQAEVSQPTIYLFCGLVIRSSFKEELKLEIIDIIRAIIYGDNAAYVTQLVVSDVFWSLAENGKSPEIFNLLIEAIYFSSKFVIQLIFSSNSLRKILKQCDIDFNSNFDFNVLNTLNLGMDDAIEISKRLSATLFIRQSSLPIEVTKEEPPLYMAVTFLINSINLALNESENAASNLDEKVLQSTRFDLKGTTYLKAKSTARSTDFAETRDLISELCNNLLHLFRCICFYFREPNSNYPKKLIDFVLNMISSPISFCQSMPHPSYLVHYCIQQMALHCLVDLPESSPVRLEMMKLQEIYPQVMRRDILFITFCVEKDIIENQLIQRYPLERQIRMKMFQTIMLDKQSTNLSPLLKFVVNEMLHNGAKFEGNTSLNKLYLFPIRSEAVNMITFILSVKEKFQSTAKRLADELLLSNFVEEEDKLTEVTNDQQMNSSSILLLKNLTQCKFLFDEKALNPMKELLEKLCMKYTREWMNISAFNGSNEVAAISNIPKNSARKSSSNSSSNQQLTVSNIKKNKAIINSVKRKSQTQHKLGSTIHKNLQESFIQIVSKSQPKTMISSTTPRKPLSSLSSKSIKVSKADNNRLVRSSLRKNKDES